MFAFLFSAHNITSLSLHEEVCLMRLPLERYSPITGQPKWLFRAYLKRICEPGWKEQSYGPGDLFVIHS